MKYFLVLAVMIAVDLLIEGVVRGDWGRAVQFASLRVGTVFNLWVFFTILGL